MLFVICIVERDIFLTPSSYILFGCLVTMTILRSKASHTRSLLGIRFTSHAIMLAATVLVSGDHLINQGAWPRQ